MTQSGTLFLIGMVLGMVIGWVWRTTQFIRDRECFNPKHDDNDIPARFKD